ncbi:MAG: peptide chain release factor N(5)-glutamine methyltransferase [Xanthomonadales bacterium]|nr:peptide chain release factor N(5)-glutamine methyltransferase [Xanthomonadales bacterium]
MTTQSVTVGSLLASARIRLGHDALAALEADLLLAHVLDVDRAWLFANRESEVSPEARNAFQELLGRRSSGEPIAYLTGVREFWSLPLQVTSDVLIPRPETELLVEVALEFIPREAAWRVADLGTGSGAVALAIACERPLCEVHATEYSSAALDVAERNVQALAPGRVHLHQGSWLEPLDGRFQVLVSNPPYVADDDPHLNAGDCRFEPRAALTPGPDGMAAIRRIADDALTSLEPGGLLAFEHGYDQGAAARGLLRDFGYSEVTTRIDLEGRERVTAGRKGGS